jgi:hypothetical protein
MSQWHSALGYNIVSAQIAGLNYLHILVVCLLHSSTPLAPSSLLSSIPWHASLMQRIILYHPPSVVFVKILYLWQHPKRRSPLGWGLVIVVAVPLALFDLSTCWVIVHHKTYALLLHSVEELRLIERRSHYRTVSVIVVEQCPSAC